uniref:Uncharacterized protein n=1 Tax=Anguilla anguilla TaxID=7936 RepID=A0A0E9TFM3_ANGAN
MGITAILAAVLLST